MPGYTRRRFLSQVAAVTGTLYLNGRVNADAPKTRRITKIETFPVMYPTVGRFKFLEGPRGEPRGRPTVVVKITAEDGSVGWGQSVPSHRWSYETVETVLSTLDRYIVPVLIGMDPFDFDGIHAAMNRIIAPGFSTGQPICKAGVDLALHDLTGRLLHRSAAAAWPARGHQEDLPTAPAGWHGLAQAPERERETGSARPSRDRILLSWTLNPRNLNEIEGLIEEGRRRGYRNFNVKVAPDLKFDVEMCRIAKRLAPEGFLWADANGGYDEAAALEAAPKLADIGVAVLEQPLPANRLEGYRRLKQQAALPILMDEGIVSSVELEEFIKLRLLDGVAMKPARCGGLAECRRQIEIVLREGLIFLGSGLSDPDLALAGSLILYGAYGLAYPAALNGCQFLQGSILAQPFEVHNGILDVPTGPGLGAQVDEAKIPQYLVRDI